MNFRGPFQAHHSALEQDIFPQQLRVLGSSAGGGA